MNTRNVVFLVSIAAGVFAQIWSVQISRYGAYLYCSCDHRGVFMLLANVKDVSVPLRMMVP